jgi:ubiquinone/menaquinone biosynthesis C-methylase UbiE
VRENNAAAPGTVEHLTPEVYWETRARRYARRTLGLGAVCSYGMPWIYNFAIHLCQRRALAPWLRRGSNGTALDVGCGVGRWTLRLATRAMHVTGLDLSPFMIERAARRARQAHATNTTFVVGDVARLHIDDRFDLILCVTVIQHIMDAREAARAVENLAAHLKPGGEMVLLEAAPSNGARGCDSGVFRARSIDWYRETLARCGLHVVCERGVDPVPLKIMLLPYYKHLPRLLRALIAAVSAVISLPFDWLLGPYLTRRSWHKVIVARPSGRPV